MSPTCKHSLGLYPFFVSAVKKTHLLAISQQGMSDALAAFREDVVEVRSALMKEHKSVLDTLKIETPDDSPLGQCEERAKAAAKHETDSVSCITDEFRSRISEVENVVMESLERIEAISDNMAPLKKIAELVSDIVTKQGGSTEGLIVKRAE